MFRELNYRALAFVVIGLVCVGFLLTGPVGTTHGLDHHVNIRAIERMRHQTGYYEAMDAGLREVYGPSETVRTFRLPTLLIIWSRIGNDWLIWVAFVATAAGAGLLTMRLTRFPLIGPVVTLILLATGRAREGGEWIEQFTTVELWAAGLVAAVAVLWQRGAYRCAALAALTVALTRETAAGLLVGGLIGAWTIRRYRLVWSTALLAFVALYLIHAHQVSTWLVPRGQGSETPLLGTGGPARVLDMMGFGLPLPLFVGPLLWSFATHQAWLRRHWPVLAHLMLPWCGLLLDRPYWGILTMPLVLAFGADGLGDALGSCRRHASQVQGISPEDRPKA